MMKHYKKPDNSVWAFEADGSQDSLITADMTNLSAAELSALRQPALEQARTTKIAQLEQARDVETFKDVTALGSTWQADERSQKNLNDKLTNCLLGRPLPPVWRDKDNNNLIVTNIAQLVAIAGAMEDQTQAAYVKSWTLKAQVNAATTSAEVDAVVW